MNSVQTPRAALSAFASACLDYLASDPAELAAFLAAAGLDPAGFRAQLGTPALRQGLLDYFMHHEAALRAACANASLDAEAVMAAWYRDNPDG
jgi:2-hydroxychromene-2-carboxylate isomerase